MSTLSLMPEKTAPETTSRDKTEFGQRVTLAREHAGLTQEELAEKVELSQTGIHYLETKAHSSKKSWEIAQACGVRNAWLVSGKGPMVGPENEVEAAAAVVSESIPAYISAPNNPKDYRTIAHSLAQSLEESGISLSVKQFLALADDMYKRFSGS